jgi:DNA-binding CsgD family transcriptional regulator
MAFGTVDSSWVITSISDEITDLLEATPAVVVGQSLFDPDAQDAIASLIGADRDSGHPFSLALGTELRDGSGRDRRLCCVVTSLVVVWGRWFILVPDAGPSDADRADRADRAAELEDHMWRIAAEVEASGILHRFASVPNPDVFPQLRTLSPRQWEILRRLLNGERVPTIASALFLSPSTVRNHLSAIFGRFGVHSQAELLARLVRRDAAPS